MARKTTKKPSEKPTIAPLISDEGEEALMINLAMKCAKKQLEEGTASSQVLTHFLKLGSTVAALEKERKKNENALIAAKTESLQSSKRIEELYENAMAAMKTYSGENNDENVF